MAGSTDFEINENLIGQSFFFNYSINQKRGIFVLIANRQMRDL